MLCIQSLYEPPNTAGGPYATAEECALYCDGPYPSGGVLVGGSITVVVGASPTGKEVKRGRANHPKRRRG